MTALRPHSCWHYALVLTKIGLIPVLGAALLLVGLVVATSHAAPPEQSPLQKPSAARGEAMWAENCAACHGVLGRGDGPTAQAAQLANNPPTDFTDRVAARQRTLTDMFTVTKEGRMERMMPPWGSRLSDDQIWDVVAYAQTLAISPDDLDAGKGVYEANCIACHAADGSGTALGVPDLTNAAAMAAKSPQALFEVVSQGRGEMPAFAGQLSEDQLWQVVDYVRTFGYEPIRFQGAIVGQVKNVTTGQPVSNAEVTLRRWQEEVELPPLKVQADIDGSFRFEGLDTRTNAFYRPEVTYHDITFPADFVSFEAGVTELSLPVNVYETTTNDDGISVERLHFIVLSDQPGFLSVLELYQFSNHGDLAYVGTENQAGQRQTVRMALPAGAQDVLMQSGTLGVDFLETDQGLVATSPVVPGKETFEAAFIYIVPYSGPTLSLDRPLYYDTTSVNGLMMDVGAKLESDRLVFGGERAAQGQTFLQYTAQDLKAGEILPIRLDDLDKIEFASSQEGAGDSTVMPSTGLKQITLLWMMLGLGALAVAFGLGYPWVRPRLKREAGADRADLARERQRLLLTLARLDQAYAAGQLNQALYQRARARRKAELVEVLKYMQGRET